MITKEIKPLNVQVVYAGEDVVPNFYRKHPLPDGPIADCLQDEVPLWSAPNPVLVDTPTGSGKTTLVYKVLIPKAIREGKNVLLVSNRTALLGQQAGALMDLMGDERKKLLTPEGIRKTEDFGAVRVITYHRLAALLKDETSREWVANLAYVILDECHFFVADARFNSRCDYLLRLATTKFSHAVRIYLSATSGDILEPLAAAELENFRYPGFRFHAFAPRECHWYVRQGNYDRYTLGFFRKMEELIPRIKDKDSGKWLVFVDSKERGQQFATELGTRALYFDAGRKEGKAWEKLIETGRFDQQVLVTTAVIDCGVNVYEAVKNVAVVADNRTSLIQMVGRKRLSGNERINLFVCDPDQKTISSRYRRCEELLEWYRWFDRNYAEKCRMWLTEHLYAEEDGQLRVLFPFYKGQLHSNELARHALLRQKYFYGRILAGETTFRKEVESWLGIAAEVKDDVSVDQLQAFCERKGNRPLKEADFAELKTLILGLWHAAGKGSVRPEREGKLTHTALNTMLQELAVPFEVLYQKKQYRFLHVLPEGSTS